MNIRKIDNLGRIVIPKDLRQMMNITEGDALDIIPDGKTIVLKKHYNNRLFEVMDAVALLEDTDLRDKLMDIICDYKKE